MLCPSNSSSLKHPLIYTLNILYVFEAETTHLVNKYFELAYYCFAVIVPEIKVLPFNKTTEGLCCLIEQKTFKIICTHILMHSCHRATIQLPD